MTHRNERSAVVDFTIAAEQFTLGRMFAGIPDVRVEAVELVPVGTAFVPYLWIEGDAETLAAVEESLAAAHSVEEYVPMIDGKRSRLYRVEWGERTDDLFDCATETGLAVDHAVGTGEEWDIRVLSAEHEDITAFQRSLTDRGLSVDVQRVRRPATVDTGSDLTVDISPKQREALRVALEEGYFEIPRETTLEDLATELGVSRQAVANRFQRAFSTLIETADIDGPQE